METGTVSAIIPTFNRDVYFLERAIDSVLKQTYPCHEIIIVDDNEENALVSQAIKSYCLSFPQITYIKSEKHGGANAARNLGIHISTGEYIAFLDDDDIWAPQKTQRQLSLMEDGVGMVYCRGTTINERITPSKTEPYSNEKRFKQEFTFAELLRQNYIGCTGQALIARQCLEFCGTFNETLPARQDYDMWLRISRCFRVVGVDQPLFTHYLHNEEQITKSSRRSLEAYRSIYRLYKSDFQKDKIAKSNLMCKIARASRMEKNYLAWWLYCIYAVFLNPKQTKKIICKSMEKKTI